MTDELQDLDNLTKHPGWLRFEQHGRQEIEARLTTALTNAANGTDDALAISQVRQCIAVKQAIDALLNWPEKRHAVLKQAADCRAHVGASFSRRGDL